MDKQQQQSAPKQKLNPTNNQLQVSTKKSPKSQTFIAKIFLQKFGNVELHALGEASKISVRVAENLQRLGLATITKIHSSTTELDGRKKVKFVVTLSVTNEGKIRIDQELN